MSDRTSLIEPESVTAPTGDSTTGTPDAREPRTPASIIKEAGQFLLYALVFFLLVLALPKFLSFVLGTPYPMASITSNSMWPELRRGDLVFITAAGRDEIEPGSVVVYNQGATFIIHRVVETRDKTVVTKGDANVSTDRPVPYEKIVGRVPVVFGRLAKIPYLGYLTFLTKQPSGE